MADKPRCDIKETGAPPAVGVPAEGGEGESSEAIARREARRRVLAGGLASAPLILTLTSRPALAGGKHWGGGKNCGPSALMSGNLSNNNEPHGCEGKTPGYWKTHTQHWPDWIVVGPCNPLSKNKWDRWGICEDYTVPSRSELEDYLAELEGSSDGSWHDEHKIREIRTYLDWLVNDYPDWPFGTPFAAIFGPNLTTDPELTLAQALWLEDASSYGGPAPVLAHCVAAYLNASHFGKSRYGMSPDEVVELVNNMIASDWEELKGLLEEMNSRSHG